jgi:hypothetical protein
MYLRHTRRWRSMNKKEMHSKLTIGFILREYYILFPEMQIIGNIEKKAIDKYKIDPYFHARVDSVVCSVMSIIEECLLGGDVFEFI